MSSDEQRPLRSEGALPSGVEVLRAAPEQEPVLANMLELYVYDLSTFVDVHLRPDGRYHFPQLSQYWQQENRFPFLVRVDGHLAGFVLVSRGSLISGDPKVWDMAEFFILRRFRRRGIGAAVAQEIWRRFPGAWDVRVLETNQPAQAFWDAAISAFTRSRVEAVAAEQGGRRRRVFSFVSAEDEGSRAMDEPPGR